MPRLWPSSCAATPNVSQPVPRWQTLSCPLHEGSPTFAKHPAPCESNTYIAGHVEHVFLDSLPTATFLKPRHGIRFLKCWTASKKAFFAEALKVRDKQYGMFILSFQALGVKKRRPSATACKNAAAAAVPFEGGSISPCATSACSPLFSSGEVSSPLTSCKKSAVMTVPVLLNSSSGDVSTDSSSMALMTASWS